MRIISQEFVLSAPFAPTFVKFDFSELPVIIGGFLMGPIYGVMVAAIKILLNFVFNGTTTAGIGMATATNPLVTDMFSMMLFSVLPFNLLKYDIVSVIAFLVYKKISILFK